MQKEDLKIGGTYRDTVLTDEHFILREIDDHGVGLDTEVQFYNRLDGLVRFPMNVFLKGFEPVEEANQYLGKVEILGKKFHVNKVCGMTIHTMDYENL